MKKIYLVFLFIAFLKLTAFAQKAELHMINNSARIPTLKVMSSAGHQVDHKYSQILFLPLGKSVEYFSETGKYYIKTKAEKQGAETIYKKEDPFEVHFGNDGYSVLTITNNIKESAVKNPMEGKEISKSEFDKDI